METKPRYFYLAIAVLLAGFPSNLRAWQPGIYPVAPARMQSSDFSVDNQDRNDVLAFWHAVYQASEGYVSRVGWTGNYSGTPGTTAGAFVDDVERRLNFFRAMCGVPSDVYVNTTATVVIGSADLFKPAPSTLKTAAAQQSALMLIRNYNSSNGTDPAITHNPPSNLTGWSPGAWNGSSHGNFAFGLYGPGAITEYMIESFAKGSAGSSWNTDVGHRRWCLFPSATDFATGDQPGSGATRPPTNCLYVVPNPSELLPPETAVFVSYPAAGFFPAPINSPYWSLSRTGANFSAAKVEMKTADGTPVTLSNIKWKTGYGDPAITWQVSTAAAARFVSIDTTYRVKVSGISGEGIPASYEYSVTLINPDQLGCDLQMTGPSTPPSSESTVYSFTPPRGAESIEVVAFKQNTSAWKENAETTTPTKIIDRTSGSYGLMATMTSYSGFGSVSVPGLKSFHLTFPIPYDPIVRGVPEQSFEIDREIIANANAKLNFVFRRGYMTKTSTLAVETSSDSGATWKILGAPIIGLSNTVYDKKSTVMSIALPTSSSPIRIRFRYFTTGGAIYTHEAAPKSPTGIFIDEIATAGCVWLEQKKLNTLSPTATEFVFNPESAGAALVKDNKWSLRLQTKLGGKRFTGPAKALTIGAP
ncbi:MAG: hypothetical protein ABI600_17385 [Luteolibacter sp.]